MLPQRAGLGFKPEHFSEIVAGKPDVGFFEVHAENYMGAGGAPHHILSAISAIYPLSLHGVGLSIGAARPLDRAHLTRLRHLVDRYRPHSFSEHLAWSSHDVGYLNDLLPVPYTAETLERVSQHVDEVQQKVGRLMLLENPATYVLFEDSSIDEIDFLEAVARRTGCGLLFDVNNVMVSSVNHRLDPNRYVDRFPMHLVGEIHLAGYDESVDSAGDRLLIDTHGSPVRNDVFALYRHALDRCGPVATLIEWDNEVPTFATLLAEAQRADAALARAQDDRRAVVRRRPQ